MASKQEFLSFRVGEDIHDWILDYANNNSMSISDVIRYAIFLFKERIDVSRETKLNDDLDILKCEIGAMFRVSKYDNNVILERIEPKVVKLDN